MSKIAPYITPELRAYMAPLLKQPDPIARVAKVIPEFTTGRTWQRMPSAPLIPLDVADETITTWTPFGPVVKRLGLRERFENLAGKLVIAIIRLDRGLPC